MLVDIAHDDDSEDPEYITDPILLRYIYRLNEMAYELAGETENYPLHRQQVDQLFQTLFTLHHVLQRVEDLATLDSILRMTFANDYYVANANMVPMLTDFPLSGEN